MPTISRYARRPVVLVMCAGIMTVLLLPRTVEAQAPAATGHVGRWTLEVYGGGSASNDSTSGTALSGFPAGTPFTTQAGFPSRAHASWFFGDGAALLNGVLTRFAQIAGRTFTPIVPLDAALMTSGTRRGSGAAFGARVGRTLSPRLAVEASLERSQGRLVLSDTMAAALTRTSDSFMEAFQDLLDTAPVSNLNVASTWTVPDGSSGQTRLSGALTWTLATLDRLSAYATAGGGVVMSSGDALEARLNGSYSFRLFGSIPMSESDRTLVTVRQPARAAMGLFGGGVTYAVSAHVGLRVDVRVSLSANKTVTTVGGSPAVAVSAPTGVLPSLTSPGIQFSTQSGIRSSLSGDATTLTTFTGSGWNRHVGVTAGIFRRF